MSNGSLDARMSSVEQRLHRHDEMFAQIDEILLKISQRQEETVRIQNANSAQIASISEDIAALRALIELQTGNGYGN